MAAKLIVHPPDAQGWRRVRYDGVAIGVAHGRPTSAFSSPRPGLRTPRTWISPTRSSWSGGALDPKHGPVPLTTGGTWCTLSSTSTLL